MIVVTLFIFFYLIIPLIFLYEIIISLRLTYLNARNIYISYISKSEEDKTFQAIIELPKGLRTNPTEGWKKLGQSSDEVFMNEGSLSFFSSVIRSARGSLSNEEDYCLNSYITNLLAGLIEEAIKSYINGDIITYYLSLSDIIRLSILRKQFVPSNSESALSVEADPLFIKDLESISISLRKPHEILDLSKRLDNWRDVESIRSISWNNILIYYYINLRLSSFGVSRDKPVLGMDDILQLRKDLSQLTDKILVAYKNSNYREIIDLIQEDHQNHV